VENEAPHDRQLSRKNRIGGEPTNRPSGRITYRGAYDVSDGQRMVVGRTFRAIQAPSRLVFSWLLEPPDEHAGIDSHVTVLTPRG
jgi:uncharacterized protein YndB with AHSA1/START domain